MSSPRDIAVPGDVYVADSYNHRIQVFEELEGFYFKNKFGSAGSLDGQVSYPSGVALDSQGRIYVADTSNSRVQRFKYVSSAATSYSYDVLGNLTGVVDANGNTTSIVYNWLSRKTSMSDPDMGAWSYTYHPAGQLWTQTDALGQTITFSYDALGRQTGKSYPPGSGMTNVTYTYDSTDGGNYGKGRRTSMVDALNDAYHPNIYRYDSRGRVIEEQRWAWWGGMPTSYTTSFTYDGLDRIATVTYPTGEVVTNTYNGRGLPYGVSGTAAGSLVTSALYNQLGATTEVNLGSGAKTTYGYYGTGGSYDTTGGYYGRLWEIKTVKTPTTHQDIRYTWDAGGNLTQRYDVTNGTTETFAYDALDRLVSASGPYSERWVYDEIGNIISRGTDEYAYGTKPHAATGLTGVSYQYDANGNMTNRGSQVIAWDVENRPGTVSGGASFVYDGDGIRLHKTEGGQTVLYIGRYYEKNLSTGEVTTYYYLGSKMVAKRTGTTKTYLHQDALGSTSVVTDASGAKIASSKYYPFGGTWYASGSLPSQRFTGQRLDESGLYYYNARYYDANLGRFISADTFVQWSPGVPVASWALTVSNSAMARTPAFTGQSPRAPETLNRYAYVVNNPLKYADPSGRWTAGGGFNFNAGLGAGVTFSVMFVFDGHGGMAVAVSPGAGAYAGAGGSLAGQFQWTSAETVQDLRGTSVVTGASGGIGLGGGMEWIATQRYQGVNVNVGLTGLIPTPMRVEAHSFIENTTIVNLRQPTGVANTGEAQTALADLPANSPHQPSSISDSSQPSQPTLASAWSGADYSFAEYMQEYPVTDPPFVSFTL